MGDNLRFAYRIVDTYRRSETLKVCRPAPRGTFRKSEAEFYPESSASLRFGPDFPERVPNGDLLKTAPDPISEKTGGADRSRYQFSDF